MLYLLWGTVGVGVEVRIRVQCVPPLGSVHRRGVILVLYMAGTVLCPIKGTVGVCIEVRLRVVVAVPPEKVCCIPGGPILLDFETTSSSPERIIDLWYVE